MKNKSIILLLGKEKLLKDQIIDEIKQTYVKNKFSEDFNFNVFYGNDVSLNQILDIANTLPVMSDKRVIVVHDFDSVPKYKTILEFYQNPSDTTVLILISNNEQYYYAFDKSFQKKFKTLYGKLGELKIFYKMKDSDIKTWIREEFRSKGKKVGFDVSEYLFSIVGSNLYDLKNEIGKIDTFLGSKENVSIDDIRSIVSHNFSSSIDTLLEALSEKDIKKSLEFFNIYYQKKEPLLLLAGALHKFFKKLVHAKYLIITEGYDTNQIFNMKKEFGLYYFNRSRFFKALNSYSFEELTDILASFFTLDSMLKSYKNVYIKFYFERFLMDICKKTKKKFKKFDKRF